MAVYTFSFSPSYVCMDAPDRIDYHVKTGDYLAVVATKLGFLEDALKRCDDLSEEEQEIARELRRDLRYVQAHYKIQPRNGAEIQDLRPSGNLLSK